MNERYETRRERPLKTGWWAVHDTVANEPVSQRLGREEAERRCDFANEINDRSGAQELLDGLVKLIKTAHLLHENAVGCAMHHHAIDFQEQGLPGWLHDTEVDIAAARELVANSRPSKTEE